MTFQHTGTAPVPPPGSGRSNRTSRILIPAATCVLGVILGAVGLAAIQGAQQSAEQDRADTKSATAQAVAAKAKTTQFADALYSCSVSDDGVGATIGDGGESLILDNEGADEYEGIDVDDLVCVLEQLGVPDSVRAEMADTTAMQGRQEADWNDLTASWSYHPDSGLDMVLTQR